MASPESSCNDDDDDDSDYDESVDVGSVSELGRSSKDSSILPTRKLQSYYGVHRDKESLLEELHALQEAFQDQKFHLQAHKEHHNAMQAENRSVVFFLQCNDNCATYLYKWSYDALSTECLGISPRTQWRKHCLA